MKDIIELKDWKLTIKSDVFENPYFTDWFKENFLRMFYEYLEVEHLTIVDFVNEWKRTKQRFEVAFAAMKTVFLLENL